MIDYQEHIPHKINVSVVIHDRINNEELIALWDLLNREFGAYTWSIVNGHIMKDVMKSAGIDLCKATEKT